MRRKKVLYDFCPLPRKRHPAWAGLKHMLGNCLPEKLWQMADGAPIAVDGDWRVSICRDLAINSRHRSNWCQAMDEAHRAGLITVTETHITVHFIERPTATPPATNPQPTADPLATHCDPTETQLATHLESNPENDSSLESLTDRRDIQTEESKRVPARTHAREATPTSRAGELISFRKPLGSAPPPAWIPDADPEPEQTLSERLLVAYRKRYLAKRATSPSESKWHREHAATLAEWCSRPENQAAYQLDAEQLVGRVLDGLFANEKAAAAGFKLSWAVNDPEQFIRESKPKPKLEIHKPWEPTKFVPVATKPLTPEQLAERERERLEDAAARAAFGEVSWEVAR